MVLGHNAIDSDALLETVCRGMVELNAAKVREVFNSELGEALIETFTRGFDRPQPKTDLGRLPKYVREHAGKVVLYKEAFEFFSKLEALGIGEFKDKSAKKPRQFHWRISMPKIVKIVQGTATEEDKSSLPLDGALSENVIPIACHLPTTGMLVFVKLPAGLNKKDASALVDIIRRVYGL